MPNAEFPHYPDQLTFTYINIYAGRAGYIIGLNEAEEEWRGVKTQFVCLGSIDYDPQCCRDTERLTGAPSYCLDMFTREQYIAFHGHEPPLDWQEVTPELLRQLFGPTPPDLVVYSPPCPAFSPQIGNNTAETERYLAQRGLMNRANDLVNAAWPDPENPVKIKVVENVPGIKKRGAAEITRFVETERARGCQVDLHDFDLGEIGGIAQERWRFQGMSRHTGTMSVHVLKPPHIGKKTIAEAFADLPIHGDPAGGPLNRLVHNDFVTNLRLASIRPGGDHKDIPSPGQWRLVTEDGREVPVDLSTKAGRKNPPDPSRWGRIFVLELLPGAKHYKETQDLRLGYTPRNGAFRNADMRKHSTTIIGSADVRGSNGVAAYADMQLTYAPRDGACGVEDVHGPCMTIPGNNSVGRGNGPGALADIRLTRDPRPGVNRVYSSNEHSGAVTANPYVNGNAPSLADLRLATNPNMHGSILPVSRSDGYARTVTGSDHASGGAMSHADLRMHCPARNGILGVLEWHGNAGTIQGFKNSYSGAVAFADPNWPNWFYPYVIISPWGYWHHAMNELELAVLQGFPAVWKDGTPFYLEGTVREIRQGIGNAVPPPYAKVQGRMILRALMISHLEPGAFDLSPYGTGIWVEQRQQTNQLVN